MSIRRYIQIVEGRDAALYHASPLNKAVQIIRDNAILDRFSLQTKLYPDEDATDAWRSNYMPDGKKISGVNLTRSLRFATCNADDVVFALDQRPLSQRHRIVPLNHTRVMGKVFGGDGGWPSHDPEGDEALELVIGPILDLDRFLLWVYAGPDCSIQDEDAYALIASHPRFTTKLPR